MNPRILQVAIAAALAAHDLPVSAVTEYRLGVDGDPWQVSLSLEGAGSYVVFDADGQEVRRVPVGTTPHGAGVDTLNDFSGESIAPRYIERGVNLAMTDLDRSTPTGPCALSQGRLSSIFLPPCRSIASASIRDWASTTIRR